MFSVGKDKHEPICWKKDVAFSTTPSPVDYGRPIWDDADFVLRNIPAEMLEPTAQLFRGYTPDSLSLVGEAVVIQHNQHGEIGRASCRERV